MDDSVLLTEIKQLRNDWKDARNSHYKHYLLTCKADKRADANATMLDAVIKEIDVVIKKYG